MILLSLAHRLIFIKAEFLHPFENWRLETQYHHYQVFFCDIFVPLPMNIDAAVQDLIDMILAGMHQQMIGGNNH